MKRAVLRRASAFTLVEVLVACTIAVIALAAVVAGATAMQRCFVAAEDFALAKSDQARLSDYIALDLRRALSVTAGTDGTTIMTVKIPDYYDGSGQPRTPTITQYVPHYGNAATPMTVVYRKAGASILRQENALPPREIAANVQDFELTVQDLGKVVKTRVTFMPRFHRGGMTWARVATTVFSTTLLRNQRKAL